MKQLVLVLALATFSLAAADKEISFKRFKKELKEMDRDIFNFKVGDVFVKKDKSFRKIVTCDEKNKNCVETKCQTTDIVTTTIIAKPSQRKFYAHISESSKTLLLSKNGSKEVCYEEETNNEYVEYFQEDPAAEMIDSLGKTPGLIIKKTGVSGSLYKIYAKSVENFEFKFNFYAKNTIFNNLPHMIVTGAEGNNHYETVQLNLKGKAVNPETDLDLTNIKLCFRMVSPIQDKDWGLNIDLKCGEKEDLTNSFFPKN